uniref:C-type lectin domain-containing protein n=1 Tax=Neolamprologus brichardi TaxID=32507 RepID=A0A3Q4MEH5_NEOBR
MSHSIKFPTTFTPHLTSLMCFLFSLFRGSSTSCGEQRVKGHLRESGPGGSQCSPGSCSHCSVFYHRCCNLFKDDPCYKCEEGWEQHGGKCYYFSISKSSWEQSREECKARRGDLVKIESREEQRRLRDVMTKPEDKFWIGLTDSAVERRWLWVDGSQLDQSKGEPDNWKGTNGEHPDGEDCVRMGERGGADDLKCWFDAFCSKPHRNSPCPP